jgi:hypothetical protein
MDGFIVPIVSINCSKLKTFSSIYMVIVATISFVANLILIGIFMRKKKLFSGINILIFGLIVISFVASIIEFPLSMISIFKCQ